MSTINSYIVGGVFNPDFNNRTYHTAGADIQQSQRDDMCIAAQAPQPTKPQINGMNTIIVKPKNMFTLWFATTHSFAGGVWNPAFCECIVNCGFTIKVWVGRRKTERLEGGFIPNVYLYPLNPN